MKPVRGEPSLRGERTDQEPSSRPKDLPLFGPRNKGGDSTGKACPIIEQQEKAQRPKEILFRSKGKKNWNLLFAQEKKYIKVESRPKKKKKIILRSSKSPSQFTRPENQGKKKFSISSPKK